MPNRRVRCSNCQHVYLQDVDLTIALKVDDCPRCGSYGIMKLPGFELTWLPQPNISRLLRWDCRMIERALQGSAEYNKMLVTSLTSAGYEFIGFHGCGFNSACSIMRGGVDASKNVVGARGRGFYVGSVYTGIPRTWAIKSQGKGHGVATILAIYVKSFTLMQCYSHYEWGMMDGDDDVDDEGLEIVFRDNVCHLLCAVPALGTETTTYWDDCPHDTFSPKERIGCRKAALAINVSYNQLATWIMKGKLKKNLTSEQIKTVESFF